MSTNIGRFSQVKIFGGDSKEEAEKNANIYLQENNIEAYAANLAVTVTRCTNDDGKINLEVRYDLLVIFDCGKK